MSGISSILRPVDEVFYSGVSSALNTAGTLWQNWSKRYESTVTQFGCNRSLTTVFRVAPIALAALVYANPMFLTGSLVRLAAVGFALSVMPDLFSNSGRVKLCQGIALAAAIQSSMAIVKSAAYGLNASFAFVFVGGMAFTGLFYYASRYFSNLPTQPSPQQTYTPPTHTSPTAPVRAAPPPAPVSSPSVSRAVRAEEVD